MARTDTGDLADVLLPATGWGEKEGTVTNSERRISRQRAFLPVPGDARPDWKIICDVAARMGWGDAFAFKNPAEVFAEYVALSAATRDFGRDLDLSIFADVDYANLIPTQWPQNDKRFFADGKFFHADGKARMLSVKTPAQQEQGGFRLNTGRIRDQWHTMTRTGKSPRLGGHLGEPYVEIHPKDAKDLGIGPADLVEVQAGTHKAILRALPASRTAKGTLFAPMHWTRQRSSAGWINSVSQVATDPISGQPALKSGAVSARLFKAEWFGFLTADTPITPIGDYCAVARTDNGYQAELAGITRPDDWTALLEKLMGHLGGDLAQVKDEHQKNARFALSENGTLRALLFVAPTPVALSRSYANSLIGSESAGLTALSGLPGAGTLDPGPTVCSCMAVGMNTLRVAIANGALSVDDLGACTGAGTNCGSCRPELEALLLDIPPALAAE